MPQLVGGMDKIEPAQQGIGRRLGGANQISSPIGLSFAEIEKFVSPPFRVAPDPTVNRTQ